MKEINDRISREQVIALRQGDASAGLRKDYWSDDDREMLKKKYQDGDGITELALVFRRTEPAIVSQLTALKMFKRSRAPRRKEPDCLCPNVNAIRTVLNAGKRYCLRQQAIVDEF